MKLFYEDDERKKLIVAGERMFWNGKVLVSLEHLVTVYLTNRNPMIIFDQFTLYSPYVKLFLDFSQRYRGIDFIAFLFFGNSNK